MWFGRVGWGGGVGGGGGGGRHVGRSACVYSVRWATLDKCDCVCMCVSVLDIARNFGRSLTIPGQFCKRPSHSPRTRP